MGFYTFAAEQSGINKADFLPTLFYTRPACSNISPIIKRENETTRPTVEPDRALPRFEPANLFFCSPAKKDCNGGRIRFPVSSKHLFQIHF